MFFNTICYVAYTRLCEDCYDCRIRRCVSLELLDYAMNITSVLSKEKYFKLL